MVVRGSESALLALARSARSIEISALTCGAPVLILTPHPDDESLGCGAAIAAACESGVSVVVACLTDGAGSHPNSPSYPRDRLAALRREELETAVAILSAGQGVTIALAIPDQGVTPKSLAEGRTVESLQDIIRVHDIRTLWTTWRKDAHVDHRCAADIARRLCSANCRLNLWQFPIWSRFSDERICRDERLFTFDSAPYLERKYRAIAAHRSQTSNLIVDDPGGFTLDPAMQEHFLTFPEIFIQG